MSMGFAGKPSTCAATRSSAKISWLESGGREQLEEWRRDITNYMQALDEMIGPDGQRPARPGAGCLSCPWSRSVMPVRSQGPTPREESARRLALIEGQRRS